MIENRINYSKQKLVYGVISTLQNCQVNSYNFEPIFSIQNFIMKGIEMNDSEVHKLSLEIEPRNAERSQIK